MKMSQRKPGPPTVAQMGIGSWVILMVLLALLVATSVIAYFGWSSPTGADVPASGYVALALGVMFSLAVGFGLMALIFYSSRNGYDEPPVLVASENNLAQSESPSEPD